MHHFSHRVLLNSKVIPFDALGHFQTSSLTSLFFSRRRRGRLVAARRSGFLMLVRARRSAIASAPPQPLCTTPLLLPRSNHAGPSPTGVPAEAAVSSRWLPPLAAAAAAAAVARGAALGRRATMLRTALAGG